MNGSLRNKKAQKKEYARNLTVTLLFFPILLFYLEMVVRISTIGMPSFAQTLNIFLFSFSTGAFVSAVITVIRNRTAMRVTLVLLSAAFALLLASQMIYFKIFRTYYSLDSLGMAGDAVTDFSKVMFDTIFKNFFTVFLLFLPVILIAVFNKRITYFPIKKLPPILTYFCVSVMALSFILGSVAVSSDKDEYGALYYYKYPNPIDTASNVGILTSTRLSIQNMLFGGIEQNIEVETGMDDIYNPFQTVGGDETTNGGETTSDGGTTPPDTTSPDTSQDEPKPPKDYGYNIIEGLDFSKTSGTIGTLNEYYSSLTPTKKNEYTGMFEGYNLIFLTLEGFSGKVINPNLTPTLYKMANSGFVFENFYNGTWGGSTSTGEYANLTGNFYNSTKCMTDYVGKTYQPFALGNQFKSLGYTTKAYHAWTYTYYDRHESHPSLGYEWIAHNRNNDKNYTGLDNFVGPDGEGMSFPWVPSDYDTARITVSDFIDKEPFHVYYMTISGHTNYNWGGNAMCKKHRSEINDYCQKYGLNYSEEVKAYLACQLEVELMLTELVERLEEAGKLDNTVFVMGADHYPYGLSDASLAELYGIPEDGINGNFELYRNTLIIWNSAMEETVYVDTPCSALDILPTVSNLFGLEYDSRLMAGVDVLSDTEPIVIVNFDEGAGSWNWLTRYGSYKTKTKQFTPASGFSASDAEIQAYVKSVNRLVSAKNTYTKKLLENDYYAYVFGKKK